MNKLKVEFRAVVVDRQGALLDIFGDTRHQAQYWGLTENIHNFYTVIGLVPYSGTGTSLAYVDDFKLIAFKYFARIYENTDIYYKTAQYGKSFIRPAHLDNFIFGAGGTASYPQCIAFIAVYTES